MEEAEATTALSSPGAAGFAGGGSVAVGVGVGVGVGVAVGVGVDVGVGVGVGVGDPALVSWMIFAFEGI